MTPTSLEGGCACGAIRYRIQATHNRVTHCHCLHCRRTSGAPFVTWIVCTVGNFEILQGSPREYETRPLARRQFCSNCGTQLTFRETDKPDSIDVTAASLDDPEQVAPEDHVWSRRRICWVRLADDLPQHSQHRE